MYIECDRVGGRYGRRFCANWTQLISRFGQTVGPIYIYIVRAQLSAHICWSAVFNWRRSPSPYYTLPYYMVAPVHYIPAKCTGTTFCPYQVDQVYPIYLALFHRLLFCVLIYIQLIYLWWCETKTERFSRFEAEKILKWKKKKKSEILNNSN